MKNLALLTAATVLSFNAAAASTNYKFVPQDETSATNLCLVAAEQGYSAARQFARAEQNIRRAEFDAIECNGKSIRTFARNFNFQANSEETVTEYQFKLVDSTEATKTCAYAAENGLAQAIKRGGQKVTELSCNGLPIRTFARRYGK